MRGHPPSGFNKAERFREAIMFGKSRSAVLAAALLCLALPAWGQDWTQRLPDGKGKETVAAICAGCHEFFSRLGAGYSPEGWRTVMRMMINQGTPVPPDQIETVTQYLIQSFPEKPKPAGMTPSPAGSRNIRSRPRIRGRTASSRTRTATSGTPRTPQA